MLERCAASRHVYRGWGRGGAFYTTATHTQPRPQRAASMPQIRGGIHAPQTDFVRRRADRTQDHRRSRVGDPASAPPGVLFFRSKERKEQRRREKKKERKDRQRGGRGRGDARQCMRSLPRFAVQGPPAIPRCPPPPALSYPLTSFLPCLHCVLRALSGRDASPAGVLPPRGSLVARPGKPQVKFKSIVFSETSGSVGGMTYSHNRGGLYVRARAVPVNPGSPQQELIRGFMAFLTSQWTDFLTQDQRDAWDLYADNVHLIDRIGEPRNAGGLAHFVRSNVPRMQSPLPIAYDAPTQFSLGSYTPPTMVNPSEATQDFLLLFDNTDKWADQNQAAMIVYCSRPQNASVNYFKGPYRLAGRILGQQGTPPPSPATIDTPFPFVAGQKLFIRFNVTRANGRLALAERTSALCVNGPPPVPVPVKPPKPRK